MSELPPDTAAQSEVVVRSVRRRRSEPPPPNPRVFNTRSFLIYLGLACAIVALMVEGFLRDRPQRLPLPPFSYAAEVRSAISQQADSLQVVVSWDLTLSEPEGRPDSIRVRVAPDRQEPLRSAQPGTQLGDTIRIPAPPRGQTLSGISCAAAEQRGVLQQESCTPWQYVRPAAEPSSAPVNQVVIQPSGLQVDPDIGGRCAEWQRANPGQSVWIAVNRTAVPECTGPNRRPTVAQFCAFMVLPDGRRVKSVNSINNSYCDELFVAWSRELYSSRSNNGRRAHSPAVVEFRMNQTPESRRSGPV
jgi:hypothetical protein